jgi:hypothetical protein
VDGIVRDVNGTPVAGATVTIVNTATNQSTIEKADTRGQYTLLNLQPGTYRMTVIAGGFETYRQQGILLEIGQHATQNVALQVGGVQSTVTVQADVTGLDTIASTVSDEVNGPSIRNLPLNTRNPYALAELVPGFQGTTGDDYNSNSVSIDGGRQGYTDSLVDGSPAGFPTVNGNSGIGVIPSVDAIGEYSVLAQNYPAEYGRSAGGIFNMVFKSGTNQFHGTLFEFLRNSEFDANDFFSDMHKAPLPAFHRNQFGGVLDGPIYRDKTFFLLSTELLRQNEFTQVTTSVPTLLQRAGDFSQTFASNGAPVTIYNPFSTRLNPVYGQPGQSRYIRDPFPGNVVPAALMSKVAQNVMNYFPLPTSSGNSLTGANNFFASGSTVTQTTAWDVRVDHNISDTQKIFARYSNRFYSSAPNPLFPKAQAVAEGLINGEDFAKGFTVGYTDSLDQRDILDVRLGFARTLYNYLNNSLGFQDPTLGLPSDIDAAGATALFPTFTASGGYTTLGNEGNRHNAFMDYSLLGSLTMVRGPHTIKFGFDGRMLRINDHESDDSSGFFQFSQGFTQGPDPQTASTIAGNAIASLLLGTGTGDEIQNYKDVATQSFYTAEYLQDDWRATPRLTLNLGVRYDLDTPRTERYNRMNYFDPTAASPLDTLVPGLAGGLVFVGTPGHSRHQYNMDINNLAPRIGFAYSPTPTTVVHGGGAIVYGPSAQAAAGTVGPYGFRVQNSWASSVGNNGITPLNTLDNPFPQGFQPPPGAANGLLTGIGSQIEGVIRNTPTPYSEQWGLDVQQSLNRSTVCDMAYMGNRARKQQQSREGGIDWDQLPVSDLSYGASLSDQVPNPYAGTIPIAPFNGATIARSQLLRPYSQYTSVLPLFLSGGNIQYDALQLRLERRLANGLQVQASYVWARNFDNGTNHQDSYNPMGGYAVSSQDIRQRLVASYLYNLPFGRAQTFGSHLSRPLDLVAGGWQLNGITTLQGGTPLQISATNASGLGNPVEYANWNYQNPSISGPVKNRVSHDFKTADFTQPAAFTLGNAPAYLNELRSPGYDNTDFSIFKIFPVTEQLHIEFRTEAFNVFNHPQFSSPDSTVTDNSFGEITSQANNPRQIQFGLKLLF